MALEHQTNAATMLPALARYERKLVVPVLNAYEVEHLIKMHPAAFVEVFHERWINNIYFDTPDLSGYWDNVCGSQKRIKARIRWYGELMGPVQRGSLELKIRDGVIGYKLSHPVSPFVVDRNLNEREITRIMRAANGDQEDSRYTLTMQPVLINRYRRKYFISADPVFRLTLDSDIEYYKFLPRNNSFRARISSANRIILECKYGVTNEEWASAICSYFPFRLTKSSKYVDGVTLLDQL